MKTLNVDTAPNKTLPSLTAVVQRARRSWQTWRGVQVPVILQLNAVECGAACLAMVLSYHGRNTAVSDCREALGTGRDGVTAQTIARVARGFGLQVKAYSLQGALEDFRYVRLPAIIHWGFNHFVVVERWTPTKVTLVDPAQGRIVVTAEEWATNFTGVVLTFAPSAQFQRRRTMAHTSWKTYLRHLLELPGTPGLLGQVLGASLFLQLLGLLLPILTKVLLDYVLPFRLTDVMTMLSVGMVVLVLAQALTSYLRATLIIFLSARLDSHMMLGFFDHLLSLPFRFFQERTAGDLLMRLSSNSTIRDTLTSQTLSVLLDGFFVMVYLGVLVAVDLHFGLLVLGIGVLQIILVRVTMPRVQGLVQRDLVAQAESQSYLVEALNGVATLKAAGAESRAFDRWSNLFFKQLNVSLERQHLSAWVETILLVLRAGAPLLLLCVGASRVLDGAMTVGTMLALNGLASSFLAPLTSLVTNLQRLQVVSAHLQRLADVMEAAPEQQLSEVRPAPPLAGKIEIEGVSFRYDNTTAWVLRDVTLHIQPGQKVAVVGTTGSGKSTLAKLLLGLYPPTEGHIRYDGVPLDSLNYQSVRSQMGVVLQESFLFSGSIRENIAFNAPTLPLGEVMHAAQQAQIHPDIMKMPMGYETRIAEAGSGLSGGQRQRLSLARALAASPALLILDEATSHLDVVTEGRVDDALSDLACTRVVIAHRLSTIRNADLIVVLEDGRIVEQGSHDDLVSQGGSYARLVHSQMERATA